MGCLQACRRGNRRIAWLEVPLRVVNGLRGQLGRGGIELILASPPATQASIFVRGEVIKTVKEADIVETLIEEAMRLAEEMVNRRMPRRRA